MMNIVVVWMAYIVPVSISSWNVSWPSGDSASFVQIDFDCHNREREEKEILGKTVVVGALTPVKWFLSEVLERKYPKVMDKKLS